MHALPPIEYCQRCTYSWAASSVRSVSAVHVSGAEAGGVRQAGLDVTISKLSPMVRQQYCFVVSPTYTCTSEGERRVPPAFKSSNALSCWTPGWARAMFGALAP